MPAPSTPSPLQRGDLPGLEDVPLAYRDVRRERERLETAGLVDLSAHGILEVRGPDAPGFLEDVVAGPVGSADPGEAAPTLLLDTDGKVQAVAVAWIRGPEAVDLLVQAPHVEEAREELGGYARLADVTVEEADDALLHLAGDQAGDVLGDVLAAPEAGAVVEAEGAVAGGHGLGAGPGYTVRVPAAGGRVEDLAEAARARGGGPAGWRAAEARRIAAGVPRAGAEATGERFPQEAGLTPGVDLEKGCFVGQETVARIANRGQVNWRVVHVAAADPLRPGQPLRSAGEVGEVTSASAEARPPQALAVVRREVAEEGSRLASPAGPVDVRRPAAWGRELGLD